MPQQSADKALVTFKPGLITEGGPLDTPEGATVDEQNFHLLIDGSRKRRRGLKLETGGSVVDLFRFVTGDVTRVGRWHNAGSIPENDLIVLQAGTHLYFFEDTAALLSTEFLEDLTIDLRAFTTLSTINDVGKYPVSFASGNGYLIVTGRYVSPFYVEWDATTLETFPINIRIRDFDGIDDGIPLSVQPTTLTDAHEYNLRNRGWREDDWVAYETANSKYPAKAMLWHKGYAREVDDTVYSSLDGERQFNAAKMIAEPFSDTSAPQGSFLLNAFDTVNVTTGPENPIAIATLDSVTLETEGYRLTFTTAAAHGLGPTDLFVLDGTRVRYTREDIEHEPPLYSHVITEDISGEYEAFTGTTGTTLILHRPYVADEDINWTLINAGYVEAGAAFTRPDGYTTDERPAVAAWYAGRVWFGGTAHPKLSDRILFSQTIQNNNEYGRMYQKNDPTSEELNNLIPTDGGVLQLPDIGVVKGMMAYQNSLLVLADNGVWEVNGGRDAFTPETARARQITNVGCASPWGFREAEGRVLFVGNTGLFSIQPDPETGILYANSITMEKVQSEFSKIPTSRVRKMKIGYDSVNKHAWFLFDRTAVGESTQYRSALVYDLRLQAWSKFELPVTTTWTDGVLADLIHVTEDSEVGTYQKMKFFIPKVVTGTPNTYTLTVADLDHTDYTDWDGTESDAFLLMGADVIGNWHSFRQAPVVHVFMRRTETGFTGDPPVATNPASIKMRARWDWTDRIDTGKWGSVQQAYREEVYKHQRPWVPEDLDGEFDDGYPVVVTRNKVRGRGRALQLWFSGEATYDAHLLGYAIRYKMTGRV